MYDIIKRQNGETFAQTIRQFDSGIFDIPNLPQLLKFAGRDATPILNFLESLKLSQLGASGFENKDAIELLSLAGYNAFYADSLEKQNAIQKYFAKGEELCTFKDERRYKNYYIIHAVKKNVDEIKRADFVGREDREDEYGTSVISIQIAKGSHFIKICNRYNHTVVAPDNTFYSNPDNIIVGLTQALEKMFCVNLQVHQQMYVPDHFIYQDGRLYRINFEKDNIYFGDGFYFENGVLKELQKDYQILIETSLLDLKKKTVQSLTEDGSVFSKYLSCEIQGKSFSIQKEGDEKHLFLSGKHFLTLQKGRVKSLTSYMLRGSNSFELRGTERINMIVHALPALRNLSLKGVRLVDGFFLSGCENLETLDMPNLAVAGYRFLNNLRNLKRITLPNLRQVGTYSFINLSNLEELSLPFLEKAGDGCFCKNQKLKRLKLHFLHALGEDSITQNNELNTLWLGCENISKGVCSDNEKLEKIYLGTIKTAETGLCFKNLPHLKEVEARDAYCALRQLFQPRVAVHIFSLQVPKDKYIETKQANNPFVVQKSCVYKKLKDNGLKENTKYYV